MSTLNITAAVIEHDDVHQGARSISPSAHAPGITARLLNSAICCGCLLLLSPAIVAVWIAIHRSSASGDVRMKQARKSGGGARPIRIIMKPDAVHPAARSFESENLTLVANKKIAAQAAL